MEQYLNRLKAVIVGGCGLITVTFDWMGWLVIALVSCMALDYITGTAAAIKAGRWSSSVARAGLWHKGGVIMVVICSTICDGLLGLIINNVPAITLPFEYNVLICPLVLCWYITTELGSILENAVSLGAPVPAFLSRMLAMMKDTAEGAGETLAPAKDHSPEDSEK